MMRTRVVVIMLALAAAVVARAADQVWYDGGANSLWSLSDLNWDDGAAAWANGNSALFSGGGETVDVSGAISVANISFQTNQYEIADADADGTLTLAGAPSVIEVQGAGNTGTVSEVIAGTGGITKTGAGQLRLTAANTYAGTTTVEAGVLRLNPSTLAALGATGTGNNTVVAAGATLDFNGCYTGASTLERFTIAGDGADEKGALVNTGAGHTNRNLEEVNLSDDATIGGPQRIDILTLTGNNKTLTKAGSHQLCMRTLANAEIVINEGVFTLLDNANALGGATWGDTIVNGGTLNCWNTRTYTERITFNGGSLSQGNTAHTFYLDGHLTVSNNVAHTSAGSRGVEISGYVDGPGGFTQAGDGWFIVTGNTNAYTGPTTVNAGKRLWVGRTNLYAGVLGYGTVTNAGYLHAYSSRITHGTIVNNGALYCSTGVLSEAGSVVNSGSLYVDRGGAFSLSNAFSGTGYIYVRSNASVTVDGSCSTNGELRIGFGSFSLANGALFRFTRELQVSDRLNLGYQVDPTNVTAVINVPAGCTLLAQAITFGNGTNVLSGGMTGILNHAGTVITTGKSAEDNGIRLGHYPQADSVYNMMDGTLTVEADWDLSCATDGNGWFNMTGGEVFAKRVMLNERNYDGGYGRLSVSGGVLNVGSLTGSAVAISNGIVADPGADYLVEFGGAGGTIRALTNVLVSVTNTLYGAGAEAITFDTAEWGIEVSGRMAGPGGFNKSGSGVLTLSGANAYAGPARILAGGLVRASAGALPAGGEVLFGVAADDAGGRLVSEGDLSLSGIAVGVANPEDLDKAKSYTIATYGGSLTGLVEADVLPGPWYVYYDWDNKRVQIKAAVGTLIRMR